MNLDEAFGSKTRNGNDVDIYVCRNSTTRNLYVDTKAITIPKGNYSPLEIANIITKEMSAVPRVTNLIDVSLIPGSILKTSNVQYTFPCLTGTPDTVSSRESQWGTAITKLHASVIPVSGLIYPAFPAGTQIVISYTIPGYATMKSTKAVTSFNQQTGELTFPPSDPSDKDAFLYPRSFDSDDQMKTISVSTANPLQMTFYNQTDITDSFAFTKPVFIGTSQFALEFDTNSGKFQFTQIHMPMYSPPQANQPSQPGVSIVESITTSGVYLAADVRSGIFFTDLQPADFWTSLGFNLKTLLVKDDPVTHILQTPLLRGTNMTSHFFGYDGYISHNYSTPAPSASPYFYVTDTVISIEADEQLPNGDSGYFLVELNGLTTSYSTDNGSQLSSVMNIASKNYNQSGFITAYSDGSIPFVNTGEPFTLSSIKVRILDPLRKHVVNTLGPKNSVIVQVSP